MNPTSDEYSSEEIQRMRKSTSVAEAVAVALKCRPEDIAEKVKSLVKRNEELQEEMTNYEAD